MRRSSWGGLEPDASAHRAVRWAQSIISVFGTADRNPPFHAGALATSKSRHGEMDDNRADRERFSALGDCAIAKRTLRATN